MSIRIVRASLALIAAMLIASDPARAVLPQRTFVSGTGNDANPCSLVLPCRSFGAAIAAVASGGEVIALDSAGYGVMTITKSVSVIVPPGVHAAISVLSGGNGVTVNAAGMTVALRGLYVSGSGGGAGIEIQGALHAQIENCVLSGFGTGAGIHLPFANGGVTITDTISRNNQVGILVDPPNASSSVALDRVRLESNSAAGLRGAAHARVGVHDSLASFNNVGFFAQSDAQLTITDSVAHSNSTGFWAYATAADIVPAQMTVDHSIASGNSDGVAVGSDFNNGPGSLMLTRSTVSDNTIGVSTSAASQIMYVSDSTITRNGTGILINGGDVVSRSNNTLINNDTDGAFSGGFIAH
jgi:hypothetical protein